MALKEEFDEMMYVKHVGQSQVLRKNWIKVHFPSLIKTT